MKQKTQDWYKCSDCGAAGVKLWRQTCVMLSEIEIKCKECTEADQNKNLEPPSDQIGWCVPAVPDSFEVGATYWGYTSVPQDGVNWWKSLPERSEG
jgi:hypothetical protein